MLDKEFGQMVLHVNRTAKRLVFRFKDNVLHITIGNGYTEELIQKAIQANREKLRALYEEEAKSQKKPFDLSYEIETKLFSFRIVEESCTQFALRASIGKLILVCPLNTDFSSPPLQTWLHKVIEQGIINQAQTILVNRTRELSLTLKLPISHIKINKSKGHWGSCSSNKTINLSYPLLLLPPELIDYVIIHELCHTVEMNHGPKFWALVDKFTNGKTALLRQELKRHQAVF